MGALCATGYCVLVLGQDTGEALAVGAFATVVAMVRLALEHRQLS